ncbi:hypothetical protein EJ04DRAFT_520343 [Polyplosphaeria fusca]|uniref:Uncharacterized protein n=1 Tax=Polyplosphaeria fusca TaxID=682080 RepID=A0A9P4R2W0_9PLEO|nr:hypothetical protein EJ04DRAFT_520343 [Polyplosphaeria fusca]
MAPVGRRPDLIQALPLHKREIFACCHDGPSSMPVGRYDLAPSSSVEWASSCSSFSVRYGTIVGDMVLSSAIAATTTTTTTTMTTRVMGNFSEAAQSAKGGCSCRRGGSDLEVNLEEALGHAAARGDMAQELVPHGRVFRLSWEEHWPNLISNQGSGSTWTGRARKGVVVVESWLRLAAHGKAPAVEAPCPFPYLGLVAVRPATGVSATDNVVALAVSSIDTHHALPGDASGRSCLQLPVCFEAFWKPTDPDTPSVVVEPTLQGRY